MCSFWFWKEGEYFISEASISLKVFIEERIRFSPSSLPKEKEKGRNAAIEGRIQITTDYMPALFIIAISAHFLLPWSP